MKFEQELLNKLEAIADIGAQNASKYLTTLANQNVRVSIPWVASTPYEKVAKTTGNPNDVVSVIFMELSGEVDGVIFMVFEEKDAISFADILLGNESEGSEELTELGKSALMEVGGNILANAYLNAFADKLGIVLTDTVPQMATDMLGSVIDGILGQYGSKSEETIVFKNRFKIADKEIIGNAYILIDPDNFDFFFKKVEQCKIS